MNVATILKEKGREVLTALPDASLLEVAKLLSTHRVGCVVVADETGKVVGIASERDIVRAIGKDGINVLEQPIQNFMTKDVVSCQEADTIEQLMSEMTAHRFRHMPVVERGKLNGLVSIGDVVKMRIAEAEMEAAAMREYIATG
ncbi:MAG: CBS domain-containing protein [Methyloligella sp. ZOD6]